MNLLVEKDIPAIYANDAYNNGVRSLSTVTPANGGKDFTARNKDTPGNSSESSFTLAATGAPAAPSTPAITSSPPDGGAVGPETVLDSTAKLGTGTLSTAILTENWSKRSSGPWLAYNNVWGHGSLVNGVDFTQTITIDEATFPDGTVLSWSWPSAYKYYAYPEIIYGSAPGLINPDGPQSAQTADFTSLSTSYSITLSGNTNNYDVIFDLWFTPTKNGAQDTADYELMVVAYAPPGWGPGSYEKAAYTLTDSTVTDASVYLNSKSSGGDTWTAITVMLPSNMLSGTISISDIIKSSYLEPCDNRTRLLAGSAIWRGTARRIRKRPHQYFELQLGGEPDRNFGRG